MREGWQLLFGLLVTLLTISQTISERVSRRTAVEGHKVILPCHVPGDPATNVSWTLNVSEVHGERFEILPSGDLEIKILYLEDSGTYLCRFQNKSMITKLGVKQSTRIVEKPDNQVIALGYKATFPCIVSHDQSLSVDIKWLKDGNEIDFGNQQRLTKVYNDSLTISGIMDLDAGEYTCVAQTKYDEAMASASLEIYYGTIMAPMLENVVCNDENEAEISWKPQGDIHSNSFTIQYNFTTVPGKLKSGEVEVSPLDFNRMIRMKPWASSYSFRVIANTEYGPSLPSETSITCTTQPDIPFENPEIVKVEVLRPTEPIETLKLLVSWTPIDEIEYSGPNLHYRVFWMKDSPLATWESEDVFGSTASQYTIENLPIFSRYLVKVISVNEVGPANDFTDEFVVYSGQSLEVPMHFEKVKLINNTCALLRWHPASLESFRGDIKGFKIQTRPVNEGDESIREILLDRHVTEFNLTDLKPFTEHYVWLSVYNSTDNGPRAILNLDTTNEAPSMVENLKSHVLSPYVVLLDWEKPLKPNGRITKYHVFYSRVLNSRIGSQRELFMRYPQATSAKIRNLRANTKYRITVVAENTFGLGQESFVEAKTETYDGPHEVSKPNFIWAPVTSMKIVWQPVNDQNSGDHFTAQYKKKGDLEWTNVGEEYYKDFVITMHLEKDTVYQFRVVSVDGEYETESEIQEYRTA